MAKNIKSDDHEFDDFIKKALQQTASDAPQLTEELIARTVKQLSANAPSASDDEPGKSVNTPSASDDEQGKRTHRRFFFPALVTAACLVLLGGTLLTLSKSGILPFPSTMDNSAKKESSGLTGTSERSESAFEQDDACIEMAESSAAEGSTADSSEAETSTADNGTASFDPASSGTASSETESTDDASEDFYDENAAKGDFYSDGTANEDFSFFAAFSNRPATAPDRIEVRTVSQETVYTRNTKPYDALCQSLDKELYQYDTAACEELILTEELTNYQKKILLFYYDGEGAYTPGSVLYVYEDALYVLTKDFSTYDLTTLTPAVAAQKFPMKE